MNRGAFVALCLIATASFAHRLDEYLQAAIVSISKGAITAELTLTPGVAVFPVVVSAIDTNRDGAISQAEQQAYARRVLQDLTILIDGRSVQPVLTSATFPAIDEMRAGQGEIRINLHASLPRGGAERTVVIENHHQSGISAYQVNVLVPQDPDIRILSQRRNYSQSVYQVQFAQAGAGRGSRVLSFLGGSPQVWIMLVLVIAAWLAFEWRAGKSREPRGRFT